MAAQALDHGIVGRHEIAIETFFRPARKEGAEEYLRKGQELHALAMRPVDQRDRGIHDALFAGLFNGARLRRRHSQYVHCIHPWSISARWAESYKYCNAIINIA